MKKNKKFLGILLLVLSLSFISCKDVRADYIVHYGGKGDVVPGQFPEVRRYMASIDGGEYMTYCLDPGRPFGDGSNQQTYVIDTVLDLKKLSEEGRVGTDKYMFAIAATYIYQQMLKHGYTTTNYTTEAGSGRIVGQTAFRLARMALWDGGNKSQISNGDLDSAYKAYQNGNITGRTEAINTAKAYAKKGIELAKTFGGTKYEDLVKNKDFTDYIWVPTTDGETITYEKISNNGQEMQIKFTIKLISVSSNFKWYTNNFSIKLDNQTASVKNNGTSAKIVEGPGGLEVTTTIDVSRWDGKDFGITIEAPYCDSNAASFQLVVLRNKGNSDLQYMLIVKPGECPTELNESNRGRMPSHGFRVTTNETCVCKFVNGKWTNEYIVQKYKNGQADGAPTILPNEPGYAQQIKDAACPEPITCEEKSGDDCECEKDSEGNYTGRYILTSYTEINGVRTPNQPVFAEKDDQRVKDNPKCPNCGGSGPGECAIPTESADGKYHGKDGRPLDTKEEYEKECLKCAKPESSYDNQYHCYNGIACSKEEYDKPQSENGCGDPNRDDNGDDCECEKDSEGNYTGRYILTSYTEINGVKTPNQPVFAEKDDQRVKDNPKCPNCGGPGPGECADPSKSSDGKFHRKDGQVVEKEEYEKECLKCAQPENSYDNQYHCYNGIACSKEEYDKPESENGCGDPNIGKHHCQTPETSGDGHYYGPESSDGAGDGKDLGTGTEAKKNYLRQCTKTCAPTVSIPGSCADFNETGDHLIASITDINKHSTDCNKDANPISTCVLGGKDATGTSYENKTAFSEDNKYCKVWCEEAYDFNLPTAQLSTSGEYFTLVMSVRGKRNCYTSSADDPTKPIGINKNDENQFLIDLEEARKKVIDKYNVYAKWAAAVATTATSDTIKNSGKSCTGSDGNPIEGCSGCSAGDYDTTKYTKNWKWEEYNYNGTKKAEQSDSYSSGSCDECSCTAGDNPDDDQNTSHPKNKENAKKELDEAIAEFNNIVSTYNSCSGNVGSATNGWINEMNFDPVVTFDYHESYREHVAGEFVSKNKETTENQVQYCKGKVKDTYECENESEKATATDNKVPDSMLKTDSFFLCDSNGCSSKNVTYSEAKWVKKSVKTTDDFGPKQTFSTLTPYGTIKIGENGHPEFYSSLPENAIPVSLITKTGAYPFKFTFKNIGQSNADNSLGRLIGNETSVLKAFNELPQENKCTGTDKLASENVTNDLTGAYVCHYIVNCPDCTGRCIGNQPDDPDICELCLPGDPDCPDPCTENCQAYCKNCIFDGDKAMYTFKPVTLNNLFPNGINNSYQAWNWKNDYKGHITQGAIEQDGETIYEHPQFSVDLTIQNLKNIRDYNDEVGSFVNNKVSTEVETATGKNNAIYCDNITVLGKEYNVRCRSTFLDYMDQRPSEYGTIGERVTRDEDGFELFIDNDSITGCGRESDYNCLNQVGIGPSWRVKKLGGRE